MIAVWLLLIWHFHFDHFTRRHFALKYNSTYLNNFPPITYWFYFHIVATIPFHFVRSHSSKWCIRSSIETVFIWQSNNNISPFPRQISVSPISLGTSKLESFTCHQTTFMGVIYRRAIYVHMNRIPVTWTRNLFICGIHKFQTHSTEVYHPPPSFRRRCSFHVYMCNGNV